MLRKEWLYRVYLLFTMLVLALCGCFAMQMNDGEEVGHITLIYLCTFMALTPGIFAYSKTRIVRHPPSPVRWLTVVLLWMVLITVLFGFSDINQMVFSSMRSLIALGALFAAYEYAGRFGLNKQIYWMAVCVQAILLLEYVSIYLSANLFDAAHLITSYYPLFLLPLVLMHPSKIIRYLSIGVVIIAVFSSFKRGGFVALVLGLIVYVLCKRHVESKGIKAVLYVIVALSILAGIFVYIAMSEYGGVIERLMSIGDDGGSGRTEVWEVTWGMIQDSDIIRYIIGHGFNAVLNNSPLELSAHNDLLESWYDFGLIGVILYSISLISLLRYTRSLLRKKSPVTASMAMLVTMMSILTLISHVLIYYFMTLCCLTFGLLIGQQRFYEHHK